jgi:hypothetical protein
MDEVERAMDEVEKAAKDLQRAGAHTGCCWRPLLLTRFARNLLDYSVRRVPAAK